VLLAEIVMYHLQKLPLDGKMYEDTFIASIGKAQLKNSPVLAVF
jgi:hypothetical protein